jgi:hypothetical protein
MFTDSGFSGKNGLAEGIMEKLGRQAEETFIQRMILKREYQTDITRLTLWEYFLLLEYITKNSKNN